MGLGPSIKMTTLHHFNCPVTKRLLQEEDIEFCGVVVNGVSENFAEKVFSAKRTGEIAEAVRADGAIVAIDGWGNHHIDFVNVIEQLGMRNIPTVGMSYIGLQGRLVATNTYVDTIIDFNKNESGYESCVVGDNNLDDSDANKGVVILKRKMERRNKKPLEKSPNQRKIRTLTRKYCDIKDVKFGDSTDITDEVLTIGKDLITVSQKKRDRIKEIKVTVIRPEDNKHFFINSNLDFSPIAYKINPEFLGKGDTFVLNGITCMLAGKEDVSGFQPSNIGSSEGFLDEQVKFNQAGTPKDTDFILHIDVLFEEGEGRTAEGIQEAHRAADEIVDVIRRKMNQFERNYSSIESFSDMSRPGAKKVILVKIVSGLGNMYDSSVYPNQPGGFIG